MSRVRDHWPTTPVETSLVRELAALQTGTGPQSAAGARAAVAQGDLPAARVNELLDVFTAQLQSRHLDLAARALQAMGEGFYTIGSAGHESNAVVGLLAAPDDPALLHYRSGGFYAGRALRAQSGDPVRDVLLSMVCARSDPMSGGRHKVFGHPELHIIPQTSTIASHLPRAVGLGYALGLARRIGRPAPWPQDAVVLCSFGDASASHSTAVGAINAAAYLAHRGIDCPVLFLCEDNGIGISTPTPPEWIARMLGSVPGVPLWSGEGDDPVNLLETSRAALQGVRAARRPGILHIRTVRFLGHAGSDAEIAYRTPRQIEADYARDPILATARALVRSGALTGAQALARYELSRERVIEATGA
ncbi:MAG: thiamine pyrophosphate-dependent enzyme, partial [Microbacterium sp.]